MQVQTSTPGPAVSAFSRTFRRRAANRSTPDRPDDGVATQNSYLSERVPRSSRRIEAAMARPTAARCHWPAGRGGANLSLAASSGEPQRRGCVLLPNRHQGASLGNAFTCPVDGVHLRQPVTGSSGPSPTTAGNRSICCARPCPGSPPLLRRRWLSPRTQTGGPP